jgi:hypothetical protein
MEVISARDIFCLITPSPSHFVVQYPCLHREDDVIVEYGL